MTPNAKAKLEICKERLTNVLREILTCYDEVELIRDCGEITPEEFQSFGSKVEEVFEQILTDAEAKNDQKKKLKDAIDPFK